MLKVFCSPKDEKNSAVVDNSKIGAGAYCVTFMVCAVTPVPLTAKIPVRGETPVLVDTETVTKPPFAPEVGSTVNQDSALLLTVQLVLEVMVNVLVWLIDVKFIIVVDKSRWSVSPACIIFTV